MKRIVKKRAPISTAAIHEASSIFCPSSDNRKKSFAGLERRALLFNTSHQQPTLSKGRLAAILTVTQLTIRIFLRARGTALHLSCSYLTGSAGVSSRGPDGCCAHARQTITPSGSSNADIKADMRLKKWLPTVDNLRNLFLTPTPEVLSFFQKSQEAR
jgi:hypothetical protein